ncbi:MAG: glycosyltransferase family 39 protein [Methanocorpusculum sp.]|nr:glycosyltransferase family 39 protein [Methanocorpusculum sp.]
MKKSSGKKIISIPAEEQYQIQSFKDINFANIKNVIRYNPYAWMLIALTLIGIVLRFVNLGFNSIWLDEGASLDFAQKSLSGIWESTAGGEFNPPLFYWFEHFMLAFGSSEVILRFLPALFGALTIPVFYFIGREISGRICGIITAGLITFSSFHIFYSQDARAYTTMLFFFSIAVLFYLIALKSEGLKFWILFGVFSSLAFWTHFYVFVGVGILILHAIIVKRKEFVKNIKSAVPIAISLISFIVVSLPLIIVTIGLFFVRTSGNPTWGLSGIDVFTNTLVLISGSEIYLTVIFSILAIAGIAYLFKNKDKRNYSYLLILSLILPFIVSIILAFKMPMSPRYLIYILPFFFTAIASAFCFIPKEIDYKKVAVVVLVLLCLVSIPYLSSYYTSYSKEDWRGMSKIISDETNDGDYVAVMPSYMSLAFDYYYDNSTDRTIEKYITTGAELDELEKERGDAPVYYIVTGDISAANPNGDALEWLNTNTNFIGQNTGIYVFMSK